MIFLQRVGSVCRRKERASYLQGGSEIIRRKKNRKTKSSGHRALFPRVFSHVAFYIKYKSAESEGGGASLWDPQWQPNVSWLTGRAYRSSAPEARLLPAKHLHPNPEAVTESTFRLRVLIRVGNDSTGSLILIEHAVNLNLILQLSVCFSLGWNVWSF